MANELPQPILFRIPPGSDNISHDNWRKIMDLARRVYSLDTKINAPESGLVNMAWKVKWNDHDTTPGYLADKLIAGSNVTFTTAHEYGDAATTISVHNPVTLATNSGLQLSTQVLNMGTPTTVTPSTTNSVTTTTHAHAVTGLELEFIYGTSFPVAPADKQICVRTDQDGDLVASSGGASAFTDLTDVPSSYSGAGSKYVAVNSGATALEFVSAPTGSGGADILEVQVFS